MALAVQCIHRVLRSLASVPPYNFCGGLHIRVKEHSRVSVGVDASRTIYPRKLPTAESYVVCPLRHLGNRCLGLRTSRLDECISPREQQGCNPRSQDKQIGNANTRASNQCLLDARMQMMSRIRYTRSVQNRIVVL